MDVRLWEAILISQRDLREGQPNGEKPETMTRGEELKELGIFTQGEK